MIRNPKPMYATGCGPLKIRSVYEDSDPMRRENPGNHAAPIPIRQARPRPCRTVPLQDFFAARVAAARRIRASAGSPRFGWA